VNRVGYGAMQLAGPNVWGLPDDPESARRVLRLAVELGVTFFDTANAYGPPSDVPPYFPLASGRLSSHNELTRPAERLDAMPAQVALAWLLRRSPAIVVIPGTTNPDHLRANIAAAEIAENLTDAEVARLTGLVDESRAVIDQPRQPALDARAGRR
jgi:aryl-alcohol dehydrogenase-like predicted oxidoreductase